MLKTALFSLLLLFSASSSYARDYYRGTVNFELNHTNAWQGSSILGRFMNAQISASDDGGYCEIVFPSSGQVNSANNASQPNPPAGKTLSCIASVRYRTDQAENYTEVDFTFDSNNLEALAALLGMPQSDVGQLQNLDDIRYHHPFTLLFYSNGYAQQPIRTAIELDPSSTEESYHIGAVATALQKLN